MKRPIHLITAASLFVCSAAFGQKKKDTWIDPAKTAEENPDFLIQGEYGVAEKGQKWAVQAVALGDGKFDVYILEGGFPGLGYTREKSKSKISGTAAALKSADGKMVGKIADGKISVDKDGKPWIALSKVKRGSDTIGEKAPEGAVILFDGTSDEAWNKDDLIANGLLKNTDIATNQKFKDYHLHLEFRTPFKPFARGQGRGNSGVYHQHRYETQVLDAFGLEGEDNETGGIYKTAKPIVNMCLPPLEWQTYDVDFTAAKWNAEGKKTASARMTVKLNGFLIHDDVEIPKSTGGGKPETSEPGPIFLQGHGNPVFYRNIWIVEK
ncbi:DUF1080 domain-containing protein [Verrucomicrobiales bacterium]|jgi:hypothetical protein|nr:DUF1080 domain-containing protein [Verrucomicrobiales bacterium]MDC0275762.1 DUF1080 domain-containing protein [Verrucomicrobiales bacterium]MDC0291860.1 DUF1080 domain-containing protein [Verrucomicrobiales bacterium]MDC0314209.1 DUF1080 domain-containing protein [bacterium]